VLEDPDSDQADLLLPYLARADYRGVEARDTDPQRAMSTVKGIVLHALASYPDPPDQISFSCIDLSRNQKVPHASP
jgi:hypothetical protein